VARIIVEPGGLTPGWHAVQFYAVGQCEPETRFKSAKGIRDHIGRNHGFLNADGPKEGDLPNIYIEADGSAHAEMSSLSVRMLGHGGLIEEVGSALIIRESEDDHVTQQTGVSSGRIACAAFR
jgi:Cu-Zn family superoxide dismutase